MDLSQLLHRYLEPLVAGDRQACRSVINETLQQGADPKRLYRELMWPAMQRIEELYRGDRIDKATEHMATRINRVVLDQLQGRLVARVTPANRSVIVCCAAGEPEELGAQLSADLFEAEGWRVYLVGGGIPNDELVALVNRMRPDLLLIYGTRPEGVPEAKRLVDRIREINAVPAMNIMLCGGVFGRADGLWEEIKADMMAPCPSDAIRMAMQADVRLHEARDPAAPKKRRRQKPPLLRQAG